MTRAFHAEWIKLRRPASLAATVGLLAAMGLLAVALTVLLAERGEAARSGASISSTTTIEELSRPDGLTTSMFNLVAVAFAPMLALVMFSANVGAEYRHGTLRLLLTHQPDRVKLLAGKLAALTFVLALALLAAFAVTAVAGLALAPTRNIDTTRWFSAEGLVAAASGLLNALALAFGWGVFGVLLAMVSRSSAAAIGIGAGYLLVIEPVVAGLWDGARSWLPGRVLGALGSGGLAGVPYGRAAGLTAVYLASFLTLTGIVLTRRDVTD